MEEVEEALKILAFGYLTTSTPTPQECQRVYASASGRQVLKEKVTLLHCTSEYPCPVEEVKLRAMDTLRTAFGLHLFKALSPVTTVTPPFEEARGLLLVELRHDAESKLLEELKAGVKVRRFPEHLTAKSSAAPGGAP